MVNPRFKIRQAYCRLTGAANQCSIWYAPNSGLAYVANAKAANSTIKYDLAQSNVLGRKGSLNLTKDNYYSHIDHSISRDALSAIRYIFTTVRNPYTRALSGYLDKINRPNPYPFRELKGQNVTSFRQFLELLSQTNAEELNAHFRPQIFNTAYTRIDLDFVFFVEDLSPYHSFLERACPGLLSSRVAPHATNSSAKISQFYGSEEKELVDAIFHDDFGHFGYAKDLNNLDPIQPFIGTSQPVTTMTAEHAKCRRLPPRTNAQVRATNFFNRLKSKNLI